MVDNATQAGIGHFRSVLRLNAVCFVAITFHAAIALNEQTRKTTYNARYWRFKSPR